jgi:hypothetical protein
MLEILDVLQDVLAHAGEPIPDRGRVDRAAETHDCDGCGEITPDVDLWATNHETGEEIWLCEACGS